jgi:hypothetical protein
MTDKITLEDVKTQVGIQAMPHIVAIAGMVAIFNLVAIADTMAMAHDDNGRQDGRDWRGGYG